MIEPDLVPTHYGCQFADGRTLGVGGLTERYRGHCIEVTRSRLWDAVIIEAETGIVFPTKATAQLHEGCLVAIARAHDLIDLYVDVGARLASADQAGSFPSVVVAGGAEYSAMARRASS